MYFFTFEILVITYENKIAILQIQEFDFYSEVIEVRLSNCNSFFFNIKQLYTKFKSNLLNLTITETGIKA